MFNKEKLLEDNRKLVERFGAQKISELDEEQIPDFYTFKRKLIYSHRDFDKFFEAVKDEDKECAIVSGFNPSGTMHLGHKAVFDTNLFFQREYDLPVYIPLSDDETYLVGKTDDQDKAFKNAWNLAKELLAYGYDPKKTHIIIDRYYTNIYNLAIKYSKKITLSEVKATYGYKNEDNPGMYFYPAIQTAHILLPIEKFNKDRVLVPIGPDEDSHLRISRDIAKKMGYNKPSTIHSTFVPGTDGEKMSASKENYIGLNDSKKRLREKINKAYTGGHVSKEKHRKHGGKPEEDVPIYYLEKYFLDEEESKEIKKQYREGKLLSGEVKQKLYKEASKFIMDFQEKEKQVKDKDVYSILLKNRDSDELLKEIISYEK